MDELFFDLSELSDDEIATIDELYNIILSNAKELSQDVIELKTKKITHKRITKQRLNVIIRTSKRLKELLK